NAGVATLNNAVLNSTGGKVSASAEGGALSMNGGSVTAADDIALSASGDTTLQATINSSAGNVSVASGGNITVQNATISSGEHHGISILGAGSTTGLVQILNSTLDSNGGNITVDRNGSNDNAMTVLINASTLNASHVDGTAGDITLKAWNPNINLSAPAYVNSVRNGAAMLQVSGGSQ
ncbi:hypothetical protein XW91_24550, partial [Salmonella enterica subsp. enterica serovar Pomona]|nr:hypothetical protein [Salmonella enterica subsp. enterica serovar Pomona]